MPLDIINEIGIWISAFFILCVYSWLYRYNRFFKFGEHTLIGAAAGYYFVMGVRNIMNISIRGLSLGKYYQVIPLILGLVLYARFYRKYSWLMRYGTCFMIAVSSTIYFRALIVTHVTQQIAATIEKVSLASPLLALNSVVIVGLTVFTMMYFMFTNRFTSKVQGYDFINKIGRYGLLTALGFYLGITVMTRLAFVINRLEFLLFEWLRLPTF